MLCCGSGSICPLQLLWPSPPLNPAFAQNPDDSPGGADMPVVGQTHSNALLLECGEQNTAPSCELLPLPTPSPAACLHAAGTCMLLLHIMPPSSATK
jgi:hypothetical protein